MSPPEDPPGAPLSIRLATYSTKARGGVVHALSLAEALAARGHAVELWALSPDGARFYREPAVPTRLVPVERRDEPIDDRILRYADALADAMAGAGPADIHHAEDCLSARAMLRLRAEGAIPAVVRTIHHVDRFESPVLDRCQTASIVDVDHRLCVSQHWVAQVRAQFGVDSQMVANGVDEHRFAACPATRATAGEYFGWGARPAVLAVGGIEPRKGSRTLLQAFAQARAGLPSGALLVIAGGETLFDYRAYRDAWWDDVRTLGLRVHEGRAPIPADCDVAILGPIEDEAMAMLYRGADVLAFPSTLEGFGLVVLEALAAGTPAVVSDLPVLREHLRDDRDCLMVGVDDAPALAGALVRALGDEPTRARIVAGGRATAAAFSWVRCAERHEAIYRRILHGAS